MENNSVTLLDANVLLRYFLQDDDERHTEACDIIGRNTCIVLTNIVQEVIYVLSGPIYQIPRNEIAKVITGSFKDIYYTDREVIEHALVLFNEKPLMDFPDCMLLAYHQLYDVDVATFDQKLLKKLGK